jgi:tRNA threonylcarbamoyladenosine biosynthesis protein TsaE
MERTYVIKNIDELANFAKTFLGEIQVRESQATVVALHGDLGAGKTAFVQEIGKVLGVQEAITSPTFTIMRQYDVESENFDSLAHIDAYRLESPSEIGPLKIAELLTKPRILICIEWAERLASVLEEQTIHLAIAINEDESRTIKIGQNSRA